MPTTPELMKFKRLQRRLGETTRGTVGLLELMWIQVSKNCPRGDIGKFCNEEIAIMVDWSGDSDLLVSALIESGWLDECEVHRLVVHDWSKHAPKWVKGNVSQHSDGFARVTPRTVHNGMSIGDTPCDTMGQSIMETPGANDGRSLGDTPPVLPSPVQSSLIETNGVSASSGRKKTEYTADFQIFWESFPKFRRTQKGEAFKRWRSAIKDADPALIISRAKEYAKTEKGKSQYAVMPSTFLNTKMWDDDADAWGEQERPFGATPTREELDNYNPTDGGIGISW